MSANEDRSLQGAAAWKGNPEEEFPQAKEMKLAKAEHMETDLNGPRKGQCSRGDSRSFKHDLNKKEEEQE